LSPRRFHRHALRARRRYRLRVVFDSFNRGFRRFRWQARTCLPRKEYQAAFVEAIAGIPTLGALSIPTDRYKIDWAGANPLPVPCAVFVGVQGYQRLKKGRNE